MKTRPDGLQQWSQHFDRLRQSYADSMEKHRLSHRFARSRFPVSISVGFRNRANTAAEPAVAAVGKRDRKID